MNGWIKLHRKLQEKGFYKNSKYVHLWIHLLMKANHQEREFMWNEKITIIKAGQFITGRKQLAKETGINENTVERILNLFETEHQIEQQKTNKYRLIIIINWAEYQVNEQQLEQQTNNRRTTDEQQTNTNKNVKKVKNDKKFFYDENSLEIKIAKYLYEKILVNNPGQKIPNFQSWANEADKMLRIDKRNKDEIREVIDWCQQDSFWKSNILSTKKLRDKFDQLNIKRKSINGTNRKANYVSQEELESELSQAFRRNDS